jgi:hypothetical protein
MGMPQQLLRSDRRRKREKRPVIELLPHININVISPAIPRTHSSVNEPNVAFLYPHIRILRLTAYQIEITDHCGRQQVFAIRWARTGFGKHRPILQCTCGSGVIRLFSHYGTYACRWCHRATYLSQQHNPLGRKRLAACKLRLELGGSPTVDEPLPLKAKWKHRRHYQRLRKQAESLEKASKACRAKPVPFKAFAYHVAA